MPQDAMPKRLGLMGGTFDPPHVAHLLIAEAARIEFSLDEVIWLPAGDPPHKGDDVTDQEHRYAMTLLATADHPHFRVSRLELERQGPSYTLYTLQHFAAAFPEVELYFLVGGDSVLDLMNWHRPEEILRLCEIVGVTRPGYDLGLMSELLPMEFLSRIHALEQPGFDISSTQLRARIRAGESIRYFTPPSVADYLAKHRLYE